VYEDAIRQVLGEQTDNQGIKYGGVVAARDGDDRHIILPPNVRQDTWRDMLEEITPEDLETSGLAQPVDGNGNPMQMMRVLSGQIIQIEDGKYAVAMGEPDQPGQEQWVMGAPAKEGDALKPFVFDLKALEPVLRRRRPDFFY